LQQHRNRDTITPNRPDEGECCTPHKDASFPLLVSTDLAPASVNACVKQRSTTFPLQVHVIKKTAACIFGLTLSASTAVARASSAAAAIEHASVFRT
jgi:hypothetical protein